MLKRVTLSFGVAIGLVPVAALPATAQRNEPQIAAPVRQGERVRTPTPPNPVETTFWEVLNDTTLNRLMEQALRGNYELRAAEARREDADAARTQAALNLVPAVTANAGYTRRRLSSTAFPGTPAGVLPSQDLWDSALNLSWEVDVFGRLRSGLRAQSALQDAAGEDVRDARVALAADVARTYFHLRGTQGQLAVARRNAENQRRTLDLTQTRLDAGRGTEFDVERARAQLNVTLAAIPLLEERIAAAQYRIATLTGRSPEDMATELATEGRLPELPDSIPAMTSAEVIRLRPDVTSAENRVAASRALTSSARADYWPRFSLAAGAGYTANAVDSFGNDGTFNYAIGPVISWAAFDMGRVKARVDQAQAQELEARAYYDHVVLRAREEHAGASVRYRTARARLGHLREAAAASERAAELARLRYEGGIADFLQVLDAERTLLSAQDQLAQSETQAADAYVALFRARGASWPGTTSSAR
jgi:NodT family efflux transporter outer membrane factor (OMF) lipoprotein